MEYKFRILPAIWLLMACTLVFSSVNAQQKPERTIAEILHNDSIFWMGYNNCDTSVCAPFLSSDVEFYHDKGGITIGSAALLLSIKNNLCGNDEFRIRREEVAGTVKVYPMKKGDAVYGGIISGEHVFYIYGKSKKEQIDGRANFTHLWILTDGKWKMSRILSYNHHSAIQ